MSQRVLTIPRICGWAVMLSRLGPLLPDAAADPMVAVPLQPGETVLADVATFRAGWKYYGKGDAVWAPEGAELENSPSGAICVDRGMVQGRRALFMHPPYKHGPGKTWIDYCFEMPKPGPIRLALAVALVAEAVGKSDGVTFSCCVIEADQPRELWRRHYALGRWEAWFFGLSSMARKSSPRRRCRFETRPVPSTSM